MKSFVTLLKPTVTTHKNGQDTFAGTESRPPKKDKANDWVDVEYLAVFAQACGNCGEAVNLPSKLTGELRRLHPWYIDGDKENKTRRNVTFLCDDCLTVMKQTRKEKTKCRNEKSKKES